MKPFKIESKEINSILKSTNARRVSLMQGDKGDTKCIYCHRKLTKTESIELRMGPICRHRELLKEAAKRQLNLFN